MTQVELIIYFNPLYNVEKKYKKITFEGQRAQPSYMNVKFRWLNILALFFSKTTQKQVAEECSLTKLKGT